MSKRLSSKAATTASIVAQGPAGVRRVLAGCLMVILLGGLALSPLFGFAAWTAKHSAETGQVRWGGVRG